MSTIINEKIIYDILNATPKTDSSQIREILRKSLELKGLTLEEVFQLISVEDKNLLEEIFAAAKKVKEEIYGKRLVIFAPLYISNLCANNCVYCAFRSENKKLIRRNLTQEEIAGEVEFLISTGQKRLLLVAGESNSQNYLDYILESIATVYQTKTKHGEIRRINVNIAPLTLEEFKLLKAANIGTYQLFQETYHSETYKQVHLSGKKTDFNWRITAIDRAIEAGIDDVGIGALFGLADWKFEILALLQHINHLNAKFGIGPHTISIPRLEPAFGTDFAANPPHAVSDDDFLKIIAVLRLAVPYTGIILTTRENEMLRRKSFALGISQISAGSRTNPGGYRGEEFAASQFSLGDLRSLEEVVKDIVLQGYLPSFCTACYRLGRTGEDFMDLAKNGKIKTVCAPNALLTFQEYLLHFASPELVKLSEKLIQKEIKLMPEAQREIVSLLLETVKKGQNDVFV